MPITATFAPVSERVLTMRTFYVFNALVARRGGNALEARRSNGLTDPPPQEWARMLADYQFNFRAFMASLSFAGMTPSESSSPLSRLLTSPFTDQPATDAELEEIADLLGEAEAAFPE